MSRDHRQAVSGAAGNRPILRALGLRCLQLDQRRGIEFVRARVGGLPLRDSHFRLTRGAKPRR